MPEIATNASIQRLHAFVRGRVQGVSFRYYTALEAEKLGLVGWVRNNRDGSVETIVEGKNARLRDFVEFLNTGSPQATVSEVKASWHEATGSLKQFYIQNT